MAGLASGAIEVTAGQGAASVVAKPPQVMNRVVVESTRLRPPPLAKVDLRYHLLTPRFAAEVVADGDYIYVVGGGDEHGGALEDIERFDIRTGRSEFFARLQVARRNHRIVLHDGKIYVLGGYNGTHFVTDDIFERTMEIVDLATRQVGFGPAMPVAKANFACAVFGGKIYVFGGAHMRSGQLAITNSAEVYDFGMRQWSQGRTMPTPRMGRAVNVEDFLIVPGGYAYHRDLANVEVYSPREELWRLLPPLHQTLSAYSLAWLSPCLLLFGDREIVAYDLREKYSASFALGYKPARDTATVIVQGRLYIIGGSQAHGIDLGQYFSQDHMAGSGMAGRTRARVQMTDGGLPFGAGGTNSRAFAGDFSDENKDLNGNTHYEALDDVQVFEIRAP